MIPFFQNIIVNRGKALSITDYKMTRFWISLEEGVELVIKALEESYSGEMFISRIPSFRITERTYEYEKHYIIYPNYTCWESASILLGGKLVELGFVYSSETNKEWLSIDESDIEAVSETLRSDFITCGPKVDKFEKCFTDYIGAKYAAAVSNGTAALHCACIAAGIKPGDEVITTPLTFAASAI